MKKTYIFLAIIVIIGSIIRFYNITERGLFFFDEGHLLLSAKRYSDVMLWFKDDWKNIITGKGDTELLSKYVMSYGSYYHDTVMKPGYIFLVSIGILIIGLKDYTSLIVSALFGIGSIVIVFFIGKKLYNAYIGLISALLLAVSPFNVIYSRSGFSISTSIFFVLCGIYFYLTSNNNKTYERTNTKSLVFSGLFLGYAFTSHYNIFWVPLIIGFYEIFSSIINKTSLNLFCRLRNSIIRLLIIFVAMIIFPLIFEIISRFLVSINLGNYPYSAEFQRRAFLADSFIDIQGKTDYIFPIYWLYKIEGIIFCSLLVISIVLNSVKLLKVENLKSRITYNLITDDKIYLLYALFIIPLILWSIFPRQTVRTLAIIVPIAYIIIGSLLMIRNESRKSFRFASYFIIICLFISSLIKIIPLLNLKSGYKSACKYLIENSDGKPKVMNWLSVPILQVYLKEQIYRPKNYEDLIDLYKRRGLKYYLSDYQSYLWGKGIFKSSIAEDIEHKEVPVKTFDNPIVKRPELLAEIFDRKTIKTIISDSSVSKIKIYDISKYISN